MSEHTEGPRRLAVSLTSASFAVLFQELTLIRWLPGQVRVLAYFPNLVLLGTFLGLGLGCLRARQRPLVAVWSLSLAGITAAGWAMSRVMFVQDSASEHLFLLYYDLPRDAPQIHNVQLPIVAAFLLSVLVFVPLGQIVADRLESFRARGAALEGYCWDILGSLLGVLGFAAVSFVGAFPVVWFLVPLAAGLVFLPRRRLALAGHIAGAALCLTIVLHTERAQRYSPYYAINVQQDEANTGFAVLTNGSLHQHAVALASHDEGLSEWQRAAREGYHLPYKLLGRPPRRALVVGAGTGNDVAVLLDEGAQQVDAVEIDPVILELGQRHPDHPYSSPRVRAIVTDARSFLNQPGEPYDLIVFGTLDSMTRLSALSNVRLDNFVYTLESLRAARRRLTPDGGICLYFRVGAPYIDLRMMGMLAEAFDQVPAVLSGEYHLFNRVYLDGPGFDTLKGSERRASTPGFLRSLRDRVELPTDDWPYLYLSRRGINGFYLELLVILGGVALVSVAAASSEMRESLGSGARVDWEMFFFGVGFLLLETRSVTQMNLVWGATWLTSAVVFGAILTTILAATLASGARPVPYASAMVGLVLSLLAAYVAPIQWLLTSNLALRLGFSALFCGLPIVFAGLCFAALFRQRPQAGVAFGWNLLGAVIGGLAEFASMEVGLRSLLLVALAAYLSAALNRLRTSGPAASAIVPRP